MVLKESIGDNGSIPIHFFIFPLVYYPQNKDNSIHVQKACKFYFHQKTVMKKSKYKESHISECHFNTDLTLEGQLQACRFDVKMNCGNTVKSM